MLPSSQHQHPSSQHQSVGSQADQQQQQQHLLNTVGMSASYTATSTSYSMSYPVVTGHHLNENNNLVMHPSYGKPAAHVAHQLPPASLITLQPVPLEAHHSSLHHVSSLGQQPSHTVTSLAPPPLPQQSMSSLSHSSQQSSGSQCPSGMMSHQSSMNDPNGNGRYQAGPPIGRLVSASELTLVTASSS
ncbi:uncharacterized protein LOC129728244 isoform X1 [Wyeomyia smithii]|uniref:uncharacterized protein LOC129728244 isoform X1 n=1 Tax=Wyeomyia smithii TaxID=174621 RepID=UPI002467B446|nr:uncharacterized protein LOC129728244 isoform X1 [Wyeomyia smithii]XP_055542637.1 uncharacterized protein LOC129728244 isoform X1 [Wyeomyia smithii]XP_055542638.1 uncharacterized protein LOC129728244 isoform X1 [Wyeomyia smithii]XP_055542639.1 uncharacterized protein LOC129728244 isoform X1 [Wyeomyia smithii]